MIGYCCFLITKKHNMMKKLLLFNLLLATLISFGQATLVQDINLGTFSSNPSNKVTFNGYTYFTADDGLNGAELWRTDGTESGTVIFKEFITGSESGMTAITPIVSNGKMYFFAADGGNYFLWKTDGTLAGTEKVKQFSTLQTFHDTINNELIFTAENQLWKTDGTEAGTIKINNFTIFGRTRFVKSGNEIYFSGEASNAIGQELYKTDGTTVSLVKNIYPNSNKDSYPNNFAALNGVVYFSATNGTNGFELWKTDGTEEGTVMVKDIVAGSGSTFSTNTPIVVFNNEIFFTSNNKLWKSDGTDAGTVEVKDVESYVKKVLVFNAKLYIFNQNKSFWVSDGTTAGTTKVEVPVNEFWHNGEYAIVGNKLFFQANNEYGYEIWVTDGTANGTKLLKDIHPEFDDNNIENIVDLNGKAIFTASDKNWYGKELWISDGTEAGTMLLKDINEQGTNSSSPQNYFAFGNKVLFSADNGENGRELWVLENGNPSLLKDINVGPGYSNPSNFIELNGVVYFSATTQTNGKELWKTDGTAAGTELVKDINPDAKDGLANSNFAVLNNKLYFFANDGTTGMELFESDGTAANTKLVSNINGTDVSSINNSALITMNNELFFAANDGVTNVELWKSDGTDSGTVLLKDINTSSGSFASNLTVHPHTNKFYFSAYDGSGTYLWESDGTTANTKKQNIKNPSNFTLSGTRDIGDRNGTTTIYNTELFFTGDSPSLNRGTELWVATYSGTIQQVFDVNSGSDSSYPSVLTNVNGKLYFRANNGANGYELWKVTNNSFAEMVKDINSGSGSVQITSMGSLGDLVFFNAPEDPVNAPNYNYELWISDGTDVGTKLFQDINPSTVQYSGGSNPSSYFTHNNVLYFSATNGTSGYELWKLEQTALSVKNETRSQLAELSIYPNPTSDILNIQVENQQIESVKVYSLFGKEVMHISDNTGVEKVDISNLSSGVYLLKLKTEVGFFTKKIIKK
ncbi:hypothetical protein DIS07_11705 [Polaribacter aquimarinus]|uniref:Secretion system C-terminal sorting domain-containing protein n=3 Tax=Polaribacter TaxID=52959 RepID=A0A2U2J8D3_9FLAO|nr:hypothetical protein DIS07_11705 [Polaribacter aquimarinus]